MDPARLSAIGIPVLPGPPRLLRGAQALSAIRRILDEPAATAGLDPELWAAWLSALRSEFPSISELLRLPVPPPLSDPNRYLKFRRIVREHLSQMF
jgi:hypothetical protein